MRGVPRHHSKIGKHLSGLELPTLPAYITNLTENKRVTCHRLLTTPDFRFEIEEHVRETGRLLFTNIYMSRWAPSVRKRFHAAWAAFREIVPEPIFAVGVTDDDKFERFARTLGFWLFQETVTCSLGDRRLFVHTVPAQADNHLTGLGECGNVTIEARWAAFLLDFNDPQGRAAVLVEAPVVRRS